ncbi:MAG: lytic transglycosylase domain-containing protein [Pseudomonadota bacterium]
MISGFRGGAAVLAFCAAATLGGPPAAQRAPSDAPEPASDADPQTAAQADPGAEAPPPFRDVNFRRVKPPAAGTRSFITVQIAPRPAPSNDTVEEVAAARPTPQAGAYPWFWEVLSPDRAAAGASRLFDALDTIQGSGAAPAPRLQTLQTIADAHGGTMLGSTSGTRVSPALVLAVIAVESAGDAAAVSRAGAQGLMQLMPATAARFGVTDAFDAADNIKGGVALLDYLMGLYDDDPLLVLAAYNAGEGAVRDHGGVPPYTETRNYIPRVLAAYDVARGLCTTPPMLLTDGCVFAGGEG